MCMTCGRHFPPEQGVLHVSFGDISRAERERREWAAANPPDEPFNVASVLTIPPPARWRTDCDNCAHDCRDCYWLSTSECCTWRKLTLLTVHLSKKPWLSVTDWFGFVEAVSLGRFQPGLAA